MSKYELYLFIGVLCFVIGFFLGAGFNYCQWEEMAIQHNAAHYNQTTGKFEWNQ